jgi:uncharacterized protein
LETSRDDIRTHPAAAIRSPAARGESHQRVFLGRLHEARVALPTLRDCGQAAFPPSEHCRTCLSFRLDWTTSAGLGEIYSWTLVHRPVTPEFAPPYAPAIVTLREGYQMLTNIIGVTADELRVGLGVRVQFCSVNPDLTLPYFTKD